MSAGRNTYGVFILLLSLDVKFINTGQKTMEIFKKKTRRDLSEF